MGGALFSMAGLVTETKRPRNTPNSSDNECVHSTAQKLALGFLVLGWVCLCPQSFHTLRSELSWELREGKVERVACPPPTDP